MIVSTIKQGDTSVLIFDDYCQATSPEIISNAIQKISEIVSGAYGRTHSTQETRNGEIQRL